MKLQRQFRIITCVLVRACARARAYVCVCVIVCDSQLACEVDSSLTCCTCAHYFERYLCVDFERAVRAAFFSGLKINNYDYG